MVRILEEVLPAKFGGSPLDYQLVEEEDEQGLTRLTLLLSPKLQIDDESAVVAAIKQSLKADSINSEMTEALWSQAGALRIKRAEPVLSARGKLMPLHLVRRSETSSE
jgi:hypothetical protein